MLNDPVISVLEKAATAATIRHEAILNNISNVNTPGYKRLDIEFKSELSDIFERGKVKDKERLLSEIEASRPKIISDHKAALKPDGNNVDIDKEMSGLAENALEYNIYLSLISKKFKVLKTVISEGRR